jgi:hypothetical protein
MRLGRNDPHSLKETGMLNLVVKPERKTLTSTGGGRMSKITF